MKRLRVAITVSALALATLLGTAARAEYPDRPLTMVVAYELGALTDMQSRIMMSVAWEEEYLGQRVSIVNKRSRLRGRTGWAWCKEGDCSDGYTMMGYKLPHCLARAIVYDTGYGADAFAPIANWSREPAALIVPADSPFADLQNLVAWAGANPEKLTLSGAGRYVGHHVATIQLQRAADLKITYIPEGSGMAALQSVITHTVKAGFNDLSAALRNAGRVRILAIADTARSALAPDVPTFAEAGLDVDDLSVCFRGVAFPRQVDPAARNRMSRVFMHMFQDPRLTEALQTLQSPVATMDGEALDRLFADSQRRLEILLKDERRR